MSDISSTTKCDLIYIKDFATLKSDLGVPQTDFWTLQTELCWITKWFSSTRVDFLIWTHFALPLKSNLWTLKWDLSYRTKGKQKYQSHFVILLKFCINVQLTRALSVEQKLKLSCSFSCHQIYSHTSIKLNTLLCCLSLTWMFNKQASPKHVSPNKVFNFSKLFYVCVFKILNNSTLNNHRMKLMQCVLKLIFKKISNKLKCFVFLLNGLIIPFQTP